MEILMKNIDELIEKIKDMPNISDGGSAAYDFGSEVLVCYRNKKEYGIARECEEEVMASINKKNAEGVRTPKHLAIKRLEIEEDNFCFVLQEKAKGVSFTKYCCENPIEQLKAQKKLVSAPDSHYEKYIEDIMELFYCGIEIKPKNLFYDEDVINGGFTIIDFLESGEGRTFNPNSIKDLKNLYIIVSCLSTQTMISSYNDEASSEQIALSEELTDIIKLKIIIAMRKVVPNFINNERCILRTINTSTLETFRKNGLIFDDLSLNIEEHEKMHQGIKNLLTECVEKIASGKYLLWQIRMNEIRLGLEEMCLDTEYLYSTDNTLNSSDYEDEYDYIRASYYELKDKLLGRFYAMLESYSKTANNENINNALKELLESQDTRYKRH